MKESNILVGNTTYQVTAKGNVAEHKRAVHEGVTFPCGRWNNQATAKGNLAQHKRAVHEGVRYPCEQCKHQATSINQH